MVNKMIENQLINSKDVAIILGISEATIKNWIRHSYLTPIFNTNKLFFEKTNVEELKSKINEGKSD